MPKTCLCLGFFLGKTGSFTIKLVIDNHKRYNHATGNIYPKNDE